MPAPRSAKAPLLRKSEKTMIVAVVVLLATTILATAVIAESPTRPVETMSQGLVSDLQQHSFNPQPEPPPGQTAGFVNPGSIRAFNPQPEPPASPLSLNPQPEPPSRLQLIRR